MFVKKRKSNERRQVSVPFTRDTELKSESQNLFEQTRNRNRNITTDITNYSINNRDLITINGEEFYVNLEHYIDHSNLIRNALAVYDENCIELKCDVESFKLINLILESQNVKQTEYVQNNLNKLEVSTVIKTMEYLEINPIIIFDTFLFLVAIRNIKYTGALRGMYTMYLLNKRSSQ